MHRLELSVVEMRDELQRPCPNYTHHAVELSGH
jgi:hypothetical protein